MKAFDSSKLSLLSPKKSSAQNKIKSNSKFKRTIRKQTPFIIQPVSDIGCCQIATTSQLETELSEICNFVSNNKDNLKVNVDVGKSQINNNLIQNTTQKGFIFCINLIFT